MAKFFNVTIGGMNIRENVFLPQWFKALAAVTREQKYGGLDGLKGIAVENHANGLVCLVASDTHRLVSLEFQPEGTPRKPDNPKTVIYDKKDVVGLQKLEKDITAAKTIDGQFPNWRGVLPTAPLYTNERDCEVKNFRAVPAATWGGVESNSFHMPANRLYNLDFLNDWTKANEGKATLWTWKYGGGKPAFQRKRVPARGSVDGGDQQDIKVTFTYLLMPISYRMTRGESEYISNKGDQRAIK